MGPLETTVAVSAGASLSLRDFLRRLKLRRVLISQLLEATGEHLACVAARAAGLTVADGELQKAADAFRQRQGLASAEQTNAWLARHHLSVLDLEDALERELLIDKFKDHLARDRLAAHFKAHEADYALARLRVILVAQQDLARELRTQIHEEGQDFAALAGAHSLHPSRAAGGQLGLVMRRQLPPTVADAVFSAREGELVGPVATAQGYQLVLVEGRAPPSLGPELAALIRQELFDAWLQERLADFHPEQALLEAL
jgi:parvulin-like peptidyl-prolyl isomerase